MLKTSRKKRIAVLGSTGSVGRKTLEVAECLSDRIEVHSLACRSRVDLLEQQMDRFSVSKVAVFDDAGAATLQRKFPKKKIVSGIEGLNELASEEEVDLVVLAMEGSVGILPAMSAAKAGKTLGIANKEVLVAAGSILMAQARRFNANILPLDSEHSAIFQCLKGSHSKEIRRLILTASGGPFWKKTSNLEENFDLSEALIHPNYQMGPKNTVDSSTLMNKGLEVLEAHALFNVPLSQIEVVIHPQQIIHSFVEFIDGNVLAQACLPDMFFPIQYALSYPERAPYLFAPIDFNNLGSLTFEAPDKKRFPCLELAYIAGKKGGSYPCALSAANETLVKRFLSREISWLDIPKKLEKLLERHSGLSEPSLSDLLAIDAQTREEAQCF
jgi:1-deoxy-D-xylulose-5-phosphate reductoisomerase